MSSQIGRGNRRGRKKPRCHVMAIAIRGARWTSTLERIGVSMTRSSHESARRRTAPLPSPTTTLPAPSGGGGGDVVKSWGAIGRPEARPVDRVPPEARREPGRYVPVALQRLRKTVQKQHVRARTALVEAHAHAIHGEIVSLEELA